ncbi:uncharacterized protein LOC101847924 [Aplysia californica]|uniref:Uncharacterized protein LOC101847924 n=1 Tax=Aplysia californica TaxID=6500 RepID=A0ABM1W3S4_APLCA|nr:uncharacterized protein LOC101847924 [Aplysia californica]
MARNIASSSSLPRRRELQSASLLEEWSNLSMVELCSERFNHSWVEPEQFEESNSNSSDIYFPGSHSLTGYFTVSQTARSHQTRPCNDTLSFVKKTHNDVDYDTFSIQDTLECCTEISMDGLNNVMDGLNNVIDGLNVSTIDTCMRNWPDDQLSRVPERRRFQRLEKLNVTLNTGMSSAIEEDPCLNTQSKLLNKSVDNIVGQTGDQGDGLKEQVGRVASWAVHVDKLLQDPVGVEVFSEFLRKEFSEENILFWKACEQYRQLTGDSERNVQARVIYGRFLSPTADDPVNVDDVARSHTRTFLDNPTVDMFDVAQKQEYLRKEFSEENILFWKACEQYRQLTGDSERNSQAGVIYGRFLSPTADDPVNVDDVARSHTRTFLDNPTVDMFDVAQKQVRILTLSVDVRES